MADYKSMYYELLLASERAIDIIENAAGTAAEFFPPNYPDYFDAFRHVKYNAYKASDMLRTAVSKSEDIYIETCEPDPEILD